MTIKELDKRLIEANNTITAWKDINDDIDDFYLAVDTALEENRKAIIQFLTELLEENEEG